MTMKFSRKYSQVTSTDALDNVVDTNLDTAMKVLSFIKV